MTTRDRSSRLVRRVRTRRHRLGLFTLVSTIVMVLPGLADELQFRLHRLNPESTYSACAAIDVNGDGALDVVSGGWWYEAPSWKRHFLREVEMIRGRYDDYSNLPLDVNGDGRLDLISANYRSSKMYLIENPGEPLAPWPVHLIAHPGHMETAILVDVDQDGQMDVLPNGTEFAAWWEFKRERTLSGKPQISWIRHDLPSRVVGHGIGFGDINGDGRGDVVGPGGWLEAPVLRREGQWSWHGEFELNRDSSIPILVFDVDGDGDNDLVWARGHDFGIYWMEQDTRTGNEATPRRWIRHTIDKSWSQSHSLLLADLDDNGQREVIAGKRYMAHDGKDPGAHDPLVIFRYEYRRETGTWRRWLISRGGGAGFGVDPKVVDLDGDGDLDLIGAGRSGLVWLENLLVERDPESEAEQNGCP